MITCELLSTNGYTSNQIDFYNVPSEYISHVNSIGNIELTNEGSDWFKRRCNEKYGWEYGTYLRLVDRNHISVSVCTYDGLKRILSLLDESVDCKVSNNSIDIVLQ